LPFSWLKSKKSLTLISQVREQKSSYFVVNMKQIYLVIVFLLSAMTTWSQVVLNTNTLIEVGDTLRTAFDPLPMDLVLGVGGEDKSWDFSALSGLSSEALVLDPSEGLNAASFPEANQLFKVSLTQEVYNQKTGNQVNLVGFAGDDPFGLGIQTILPYTPPYPERVLPLEYEDINEYDTQLKNQLPKDALPQFLIDSLANSGITFDSVRITITTNRIDEVDAWGTMQLPQGSFEVLREKRIRTQTPFIEFKVGFLGWTNATPFLIDQFEALKPDTLHSYYFWGDAKEPIAIVDYVGDFETGTIDDVTYKFDAMTVDIPYRKRNKSDVIAYPNPAIDEVRFDLRNLPSGDYRISILNILGQEILSQNYRVNGNKTVIMDLDRLRKGTYLYALLDENDKPVTTKRLVVMKP